MKTILYRHPITNELLKTEYDPTQGGSMPVGITIEHDYDNGQPSQLLLDELAANENLEIQRMTQCDAARASLQLAKDNWLTMTDSAKIAEIENIICILLN